MFRGSNVAVKRRRKNNNKREMKQIQKVLCTSESHFYGGPNLMRPSFFVSKQWERRRARHLWSCGGVCLPCSAPQRGWGQGMKGLLEHSRLCWESDRSPAGKLLRNTHATSKDSALSREWKGWRVGVGDEDQANWFIPIAGETIAVFGGVETLFSFYCRQFATRGMKKTPKKFRG